ncbi:LytR/AlgR family response regulator transcription factor [Leeuwenhoekiella marinoflava]|uniref:LytTR family two component transcriptional regulator n=2 Tax=Leeuwenhoekiella marinoflava TaxID=988 RepID=A0A4Q0PPD5_9FLAO|nr:response regulator transcription factor [Leeuwenhoekiella marinoflava]RXG32314.1 LytTR family two component transcriptional regulator [Leeuwenhoekiella marinoflava]SHE79435.1 two component transcriptional regulator, LytTR family [Leeuwenhoekiella marinoflava DSM 3653]
MRCILVDDEPLALDVLSSYLEKVEGFELVARCTNPLEAIRIISEQSIDLVFLDIEMPNLSGIDLVKSLDRLPQFIFTTAYPQYALEGFDLNATDYLVKPVPFPRFLKAVARAKEKHEAATHKTVEIKPVIQTAVTGNMPDFIFVKSEYENVKINIADIKYMQGLKDYIKIYTQQSDRAILTLSSFKELLDKLPAASFLRVHRSYVVNVNAIRAVQKSKILIGDIRIPIGDTYKDEVLKQLNIS